MSLVVWLPLDGALNNNGLSNLTVINSGATVSNEGKIGKCYSFATSGTYIAVNEIPFSTLSNATVCFWAKITGIGTSGWLPFTGQTTSYYLLATSNGTGAFYHGNAGSATKVIYKDGVVSTTPGPLNEWHHYCITGVNLTTWTSFYIDKYSASWNFAGQINDVRIYDYCLSLREIKEISKGLVVHYKLCESDIETTTNLITTQDCLSSTCYNGAISKYGYGTNTDMYKTTGEFEGKFCTKVNMGTSGNAAFPYVYVNNLYVSNGTNSPAYKTLSFDYFGTIGSYIGPYKLGSGSGTCTWTNNSAATTTGTYTNSGYIPVVPGIWNHITITLHGTTDEDAQWGYIRLGNANHTSNTSNYWLFANMQLELKDHETGYAGVGGTRTIGVITDVSGYKHNGTITGNLQTTSSSPMYEHATYFDGASYIKTLPGEMSWSNFEQLTIAAWMNPTTTPSSYSGSIGIGHDSANAHKLFAMSNYAGKFYLNMTNGSSYININSGYTCPLNAWHHYAVTLSGTTLKMYVDGALVKTSTIDYGTAAIHTSPQIQVAVDLPGTDEKYTGYYSDIRIYTTCLSPEDIYELSHTPAVIDNFGDFLTYEIFESTNFVPKILKSGETKANKFRELYKYLFLPAGANVLTDVQYAGGDTCKAETVIKYSGGSGRDLMGYSGAGGGYWGVTANGAWEPHGTFSYTNADISVPNFISYEFNSATENGKYRIGMLGGSYSVRNKYIYNVKLYKNNMLQADLYPDMQNSICGLFDILNGVFYPSSGSGATIGAEEDDNVARIFKNHIKSTQFIEI